MIGCLKFASLFQLKLILDAYLSNKSSAEPFFPCKYSDILSLLLKTPNVHALENDRPEC